ncbi:MAG: DUF4244 domain-containing protein [Aeromicrobium sp.]
MKRQVPTIRGCRPGPRTDRGMVTAEYSVGTLGAVMMAAVLYNLGLLGLDGPWFEHLRDIIERALSWRSLLDGLKGVPRLGIRV